MEMRRPTNIECVVTDAHGVRFYVGVARSGVINWKYEQIGMLYALTGWLANMLVHWCVFRGGWTVQVFTVDEKSVVRRIRCRNRPAALEACEDLRARGADAVLV